MGVVVPACTSQIKWVYSNYFMKPGATLISDFNWHSAHSVYINNIMQRIPLWLRKICKKNKQTTMISTLASILTDYSAHSLWGVSAWWTDGRALPAVWFYAPGLTLTYVSKGQWILSGPPSLPLARFPLNQSAHWSEIHRSKVNVSAYCFEGLLFTPQWIYKTVSFGFLNCLNNFELFWPFSEAPLSAKFLDHIDLLK